MKIKKLQLKKFRCFEDFDIEFNTGDENHGGLTVLVAKNGEGKTAILDAINVAWGPFIGKMPNSTGAGFDKNDATVHNNQTTGNPCLAALFEDNAVGRINLLSDTLEQDFNVYRELTLSKTKPTTTIKDAKPLTELALYLFKHENDPVLWPLIAYYGDSRLWASSRLTAEKKKALLYQERAYGYAFSTDPKIGHKEFEKWFVDLSNAIKDAKDMSENGLNKVVDKDLNRFLMLDKLLKDALADALKVTGWTSLKYISWKKMIYATNANTGDSVPWTSLSAGNRIVIGLVADIAHRCCKLNPFAGEDALLKTPGIVLIDEIELHLHPSWQQQILPTLQKIFPQIQFIVTTHSPQVISSIPAECVRILDNGIIHYTEGSEGADSSRILKRIFGTDAFPKNNPARIKLQEYMDLVLNQKQWASQRALELRKELDSIYKGEEPLLDEADLFIENEEWEKQNSEKEEI